jgi:hypothetical protein
MKWWKFAQNIEIAPQGQPYKVFAESIRIVFNTWRAHSYLYLVCLFLQPYL